MIGRGTTCCRVMNLQGDIVGIVNQLGNRLADYTHDAWGKLYSTNGTLADTLGKYNPLRYRGYVYDSDSGYYYLQSRYYDPEVGRFINADVYASTGQGLLGNNMFAYCNNNPIILSDAQGTAPWPTTVMIREGFYGSYRKKGPSSFHSPQPIPTEYGGDVAVNFRNMIDSISNDPVLITRKGYKWVGLGAKVMNAGFDIIYAPVPTIANEVAGILVIIVGGVIVIFGVDQFVSSADTVVSIARKKE